MWRNIIGQSVFQITVLIVLLFAGKQILGYDYPINTGFYEADFTTPTLRTKHYTMIFHTFVMMQVFNEINSRKLGASEYNVFKGFFNNLLFLVIMIITIAV